MIMHHKIADASQWIWSERVRISRYLISGFSAVLLDWGTYLFCTRGLHMNAYAANVLSVLVGAACAFLANKFWSFGTRKNTLRQTRRFAILFICNYLFQQYGFYAALTYLHAYDLVAKVVLIGMMVCWNFLLYKYWVYAVE